MARRAKQVVDRIDSTEILYMEIDKKKKKNTGLGDTSIELVGTPVAEVPLIIVKSFCVSLKSIESLFFFLPS